MKLYGLQILLLDFFSKEFSSDFFFVFPISAQTHSACEIFGPIFAYFRQFQAQCVVLSTNGRDFLEKISHTNSLLFDKRKIWNAI